MSKKDNGIGKKIVNGILAANISLWVQIMKNFSDNPAAYLLKESCKQLEKGNFFLSYRLRLKTALPNYSILYSDHCSKTAIILQGPVRHEDNFTLETVKFYKSTVEDAIVIVSTWDTESSVTIEQLKKAGAVVVTTKAPNSGGHLNINYQIISSREGIHKACESGADYICKTRTDQRIGKTHVFDFMKNLLYQFPNTDENQNRRMIALSTNYGNMFYPYFLSDFLYFGTASEMLKMFDFGTDSRDKFTMPSGSTRRNYAEKSYAPEVFLVKQYLNNLGYVCEDTVESYWNALKEYFICLDFKTLDLYWPKYEMKYAEHVISGAYFGIDSKEELRTENFDFINWFNLYSGSLKYKPEYEKYADYIL